MMRFEQTGQFVTQAASPGSITVTFQLHHANGLRFASHPGALRFRNSDCLRVSICGISFSLLFSKLSKLLL